MAAVIATSYVQTAPQVDARTSAASNHPFVIIGQIYSGAPLNYYNPQGLPWGLMNAMFLGIPKNGVSNPNAAYPGLARSWKISKDGRTVTVHLQPKARWSDGKPVTSHDLVVSAAIGFARNTAQGFFLGSVKAVNKTTVVYKTVAGTKYSLFPRGVLGQYIAPAHVFESLLPGNIWDTIKTSQYTGTDADLVTKQKAAINDLQNLAKKINAFSMPHDVSAGPYVLKTWNPGEAILVKNKYFYNASKIPINQVTVKNYGGDNQTIWNFILGGQVYQATSGGLTTDVVNRMKQVAHNHYYTVPSTTSAALFFNESVAPFGNVKVRQAIAYAVNRKEVQRVGEPVSGTYTKYPSGTVDAVVKAWLAPLLKKQINPYNTNRKKATSLLKAAGLKLTNGKWMLSNGQPFTLTLWTVDGFSDWVEAAQNMASQLSSFGIPTQVQLEPTFAQYLKDRGDGKLAFGMIFGSAASGPYSWFGTFRDALYGTNNGWYVEGGKLIYYPPSAAGKGNFWAMPQTFSVKGYGKVNPAQLTYQLSKTSDKKKIRKIVQTLLVTTNQYVPEITLWNYEQTGFVNDKYFTKFPTGKNQVVQRWTCSGYVPVIGCWELLGFVKPR
jgi:peptide/nickel transport system substrate-binding protein